MGAVKGIVVIALCVLLPHVALAMPPRHPFMTSRPQRPSTTAEPPLPDSWAHVGRRMAASDGTMSLPEAKLRAALLAKTDATVRPVVHFDDTIDMRMNMAFFQLSNVDVVQGTMETNVWLRMNWHNPFLTWDPAEWGNVTFVAMARDSIWVPEIQLYNTANKWDSVLDQKPTWVYYTGDCYDSLPALLTTACDMNTQQFPFDKQTCSIKFGSWVYSGLLMDIRGFTPELDGSTAVDVESTFTHSAWAVDNVTYSRVEEYFPCCPSEPWPNMVWTVQFSRRWTYYMSYAVIPLILVTSLAIATVWYDFEDGGSRIGLCLTCVLTVIATQWVYSSHLPVTDYRTWMDKFSMGSFMFCVVSAAESLLVSYISARKRRPGGCAARIFVALNLAVCYFGAHRRDRAKQQQRELKGIEMRHVPNPLQEEEGKASSPRAKGREGGEEEDGSLTWHQMSRAVDRSLRVWLPVAFAAFVVIMLLSGLTYSVTPQPVS